RIIYEQNGYPQIIHSYVRSDRSPGIQFCRDFLTDRKQTSPMHATSSSVAGKAHQTPRMFPIQDSRNAMGMISRNPRRMEMRWAGFGCSVEVKYMEIMTLIPAKGQAIK